MYKLLVRNKRAVTAAVSAMFVATAYSGVGGCTFNLDKGLLGEVAGVFSDFEGPSPGDGPWDGPPRSQDRFKGECDGSGHDDVEHNWPGGGYNWESADAPYNDQA